MLVLGSLTALGPLTIDMYLPALPNLTADLATTEAAAQAHDHRHARRPGLGQLVIGPLSDALGRRRPLIAGVVAHLFASRALRAGPQHRAAHRRPADAGPRPMRPSRWSSMAIVRDLFSGSAAATLLSRLMLVIGIAPVLAPSIGGAVLADTTWRGVFVAGLAGRARARVGRRARAARDAARAAPPARPSHCPCCAPTGSLLRDRTFVGLVLISGLVFATLFSYIGGSSFVLQDIYGLSVAQFGLAFGLNSLGFLTGSQLNPFLLRRFGPRDIVRAGVALGALASLALLAAAATGFGGLPLFLGPLWFLLSPAA